MTTWPIHEAGTAAVAPVTTILAPDHLHRHEPGGSFGELAADDATRDLAAR